MIQRRRDRRISAQACSITASAGDKGAVAWFAVPYDLILVTQDLCSPTNVGEATDRKDILAPIVRVLPLENASRPE